MSPVRTLLTLIASTVLALAGVSPALADKPTSVDVPMTLADGFDLPDEVRAGWVTFDVSTPDDAPFFLHYLQGFRLKHGASTDQVITDFRDALTGAPATAAKAIRDLERHADLVGGAAPSLDTTVSVTLPLTNGTYYFFDMNDFFVPGQQIILDRLKVTGSFTGRAPHADAVIEIRDVHGEPRYVTKKRLPANGRFQVENRTSEIHELALQRVAKGTRDRDVQRFFETGEGSPFVEPSLRGMGSISPGRVAFLRVHKLAPGPYALLDLVPDDQEGTPNILHGMPKVVTFKP